MNYGISDAVKHRLFFLFDLEIYFVNIFPDPKRRYFADAL